MFIFSVWQVSVNNGYIHFYGEKSGIFKVFFLLQGLFLFLEKYIFRLFRNCMVLNYNEILKKKIIYPCSLLACEINERSHVDRFLSVVFSNRIISKSKSKFQYFLPFSSDIDVRQCVCVVLLFSWVWLPFFLQGIGEICPEPSGRQ